MAQHGFPGFGGYHECDHCGTPEERVFIDSWTRMELCLSCLARVAWHVTNSPESEPDNLKAVLERKDEAVL